VVIECSKTRDTEISLLSTLIVANHTSQTVTFTQFHHVQQVWVYWINCAGVGRWVFWIVKIQLLE